MFYRLCLVVVLFNAACKLYAQSYNESDFIHYTINDGLSDNFIRGIRQDEKGYVWIGTRRGLNRFDGSNFKQFLKHEGPNSIIDNSVFNMEMLPGNQLALATDGGAQLISTETLTTTNLEIPTSNALRYWSLACKYILNDKYGNIGVATKTGFYVFSKEGKLKKRYDAFTDDDIGKAWMNFGNYIYQLPDGSMMEQGVDSLLLYDAKNNQITRMTDTYPLINELRNSFHGKRYFFINNRDVLIININNNCFELADLNTGEKKCFRAEYNLLTEAGWRTNICRVNDSVWAFNGYSGGMYLLTIDTATKTIRHKNQKFFGDYLCNIIFTDADKRMWVGTNKGLFMQKTSTGIISSFAVDNANIKTGIVIKSLIATPDKIFAGTENGEVLLIDKISKKLINRVQLKVKHKYIPVPLTFLQIHPDTLWMTTYAGLFWLHTRKLNYGYVFPPEFEEPKISESYVMFLDSRKNIWIGPNSINKVYMYDRDLRRLKIINTESDPLFNTNIVTHITEDVSGNIWLGGDAIVRWNRATGKIDTTIEHLPTQQNWKKGYAVMSNSKGEIWIMINDDGIVKLTGSGRPLHLRPFNFLPDYSQFVYPALINDKIIIVTTSGIGFFNLNDRKAIQFTQVDGLPATTNVSTIQFRFDSSDHSIWFAKQNIICNIPEQTDNIYMRSPLLSISELALLKGDIFNYPGEKISLNYLQNDIKISLGVINYTDPGNMRFAYRYVNEKDSSWIDIGTQQTILFTNISPGRYKLQVKVYAHDNKWAEQVKAIDITIMPPFWKTAWFIILAGLLTIASIYLLYSMRIKQIKQRAALDKLLAQTEMKALHTQMNPHFIFNCLNSIKTMILDNENGKASRYLSKFAQLIRITLNQSSKSFISLHSTIDYLERYLEMEQIRTNKFKYNIETESELHPEDIYLPPMLIQPLIENAIWHGELPENEIMQINIRFQKQDNKLVCIVEDNGIGIESSLKKKEDTINHHSLGIANIRQRIQVLNEKYSLHSTLTIEDKSGLNLGRGTIATLLLPIKNTDS